MRKQRAIDKSWFVHSRWNCATFFYGFVMVPAQIVGCKDFVSSPPENGKINPIILYVANLGVSKILKWVELCHCCK